MSEIKIIPTGDQISAIEDYEITLTLKRDEKPLRYKWNIKWGNKGCIGYITQTSETDEEFVRTAPFMSAHTAAICLQSIIVKEHYGQAQKTRT